jgi:hypothetical protein
MLIPDTKHHAEELATYNNFRSLSYDSRIAALL